VNDNAYRTRSERGEVQLGTWLTMIRTPAVFTLLQAAGLDFVRVDMEHSPFSMETVADMAVLARALDFPMVVRPPEGNREWITRRLDAGVWNLHVPQVDTPEQAREVASCAHYAPLGERGMYDFGPHTGYRTLPPAEHMATANARVHVTAMLETKAAFDRLDEIVSRCPATSPLDSGYSRSVFRYARKASARSGRARANSTVALRKPSLSPVS
jgi:2-keto-3-deoxy-L-rhamnonate aldolase RhmA